MTTKIEKTIIGFFSEAKDVCGSEGLFQSIFYHQCRLNYKQDQIRREEAVDGGRVDFVIEETDRLISIELKAGANGHRNSLANMKEVENTGKGLQHDIDKLLSLQKQTGKHVESWLVCVDLLVLGIAFSKKDVDKYSSVSNKQGVHFAYLAQLNDNCEIWENEKRKEHKLCIPDCTSNISALALLNMKSTWTEFFYEVATEEDSPECAHVGLLYHILRRKGLKHTQLASEVFFNCNKYGTRQYYIPDIAVFGDKFIGQFQLFGNNKRTIENDKYKLPELVSIMEFKGGRSFKSKGIKSRQEAIISDVEKLSYQIKPIVEAASLSLKINTQPHYIMIITDDDPRLKVCIDELRQKHGEIIDIKWQGL